MKFSKQFNTNRWKAWKKIKDIIQKRLRKLDNVLYVSSNSPCLEPRLPYDHLILEDLTDRRGDNLTIHIENDNIIINSREAFSGRDWFLSGFSLVDPNCFDKIIRHIKREENDYR